MHTRKRARREIEERKDQEVAAASSPAAGPASASTSHTETGAAAAEAASAAAAPSTTIRESNAPLALSAAQQSLIAIIHAHPEQADRMLAVLQRLLPALFAAPTAAASASASVGQGHEHPYCGFQSDAEAAQSGASSSHGSSLPRLSPEALSALRECALVTPFLATVLSFLPPLERMEHGRVSRPWRLALHHPSLWNGVGWHCPSEKWEQRLAMPEWIKQRMTVMRCGVEWILRTGLLSQFRAFTQLRRLDLLSYRWYGGDVSAAVLRQALQPLRLEALSLPHLSPADHDPLLSVLTRSTAARPSLLAAWAPTLAELQLYAKVDESDRLLQALAELSLPALCSLTVTLIYKPHQPFVSTVPELLKRALTPQRVPQLHTLNCRHERDRYMPAKSPGTVLASVWLPILPNLESLTSLTLSRAHFLPPLPAHTLFQTIGALPLRTLDLQGVVGPATTAAEQREVERILQRMDQLSDLSVVTSFTGGSKDWLHSLRQLPSLLTLKVDHKMAHYRDRPTVAQIDAYRHSISTLPRLQSLTFNVPEETLTPRLAQLWWRQCGQPPLASGRFKHADWQKLQQSLDKYGDAATSSVVHSHLSPPAIIELRFPHSAAVSGPCFAYLAHLPQLRVLEVALQPDDIRHLELLQQLRSLTLWLHDGEGLFRSRPPRWTNAALRAIGDTPMPQLHTLELAGSNENPVYDWCDPADPNFDWTMTHDDENIVDSDDHELEQPVRAELEQISVEGGMRHLLQLPALTRLTLPYVPRDSVDYLHALAQQSGLSLLVESKTPFSRRSEFDARWIDSNSPPLRPKLHTESLLATQFE